MKTPVIPFYKSANDPDAVVDTSEDNGEKRVAGQRLEDALISKRKLNLNRRITNSDRRFSSDPNYKGPARRNTIDRRRNTKDRRYKD